MSVLLLSYKCFYLHIVVDKTKRRSSKMPIVQEREKTVSFFKYEVLEIDFLLEYPTNKDTNAA